MLTELQVLSEPIQVIAIRQTIIQTMKPKPTSRLLQSGGCSLVLLVVIFWGLYSHFNNIPFYIITILILASCLWDLISGITMKSTNKTQNESSNPTRLPSEMWTPLDDAMAPTSDLQSAEWLGKRILYKRSHIDLLIPFNEQNDAELIECAEALQSNLDNLFAQIKTFLDVEMKSLNWKQKRQEISELKVDSIQFFEGRPYSQEIIFSGGLNSDSRVWKCAYENGKLFNLGFDGS